MRHEWASLPPMPHGTIMYSVPRALVIVCAENAVFDSFIHSLVGFIYWNTSISRVCTLLFSVAWKNCSSGMWRHCCPLPPSLPHTPGVNRRGTMTSHCTHSSRRTTLKYGEHIIAIGIYTTICSPTNSVNIEVNYMKRR